MKRLIVAVVALCAVSCAKDELARSAPSGGPDARPAAAPAGAVASGVVLPDQIRWQDGPPSLPPGAKFAVLEGDPAKEGYFAMRVRVPDGYRIPPHWHPGVERVTVISGTFNLGDGEKFDRSATRAMPAGTYSFMQPGMRHFAWAEGETVVQVATVGPWGITYVNPADDPRRK
jgi:quercetin dioxygenase-like cupin family protein